MVRVDRTKRGSTPLGSMNPLYSSELQPARRDGKMSFSEVWTKGSWKVIFVR